jgi:hypothetical protein
LLSVTSLTEQSKLSVELSPNAGAVQGRILWAKQLQALLLLPQRNTT